MHYLSYYYNEIFWTAVVVCLIMGRRIFNTTHTQFSVLSPLTCVPLRLISPLSVYLAALSIIGVIIIILFDFIGILRMSGKLDGIWPVMILAATCLQYIHISRCIFYRTAHFKFTLRWETADEVSLHLNLSPGGKVLSPIQRYNLIFGELSEVLNAVTLPLTVRRLTIATPWFSHTRPHTSQALFSALHAQYPHASIVPYSRSMGKIEQTWVCLVSTHKKQWRKIVRRNAHKQLNVKGFTISLTPKLNEVYSG
ncbi:MULTISPECIES: hypothetical protein [unclassified Janthinobacterium]|uniref:hypothetical protein n=1 Tax=unclassified Janthinobacterium TaxID=2610881 RepID=UPI001E4D386F|nr:MULTISPECIES: hypothetical protein [unclassified Janthinobacterium]MCC7645381.1 hypothetical protein [Janthinobacterium sp. EB271-G4-3-1]MCC7690437.1 hypothetical protein [Janthinobacterium sp. EB271-G4-3-2]